MYKQNPIGLLALFFTVLLTTNLSAQKTRGDLHFRDGTIKSGFAKIIGIERVKFRTSKKEKPTNYRMVDMEKVVIHDFETSSTFVLRETNTGKFRLMKELEVGEVSLYTIEYESYSGPIYTGNSVGVGWVGGSYYNIKNLYVQKKGEIQVTHLGSSNGFFSKNFKKAATAYFKNCPSLAEKIENKEFKKRDIRVIVKYYNKTCVSSEIK